jgi:hypothetical protein
MYYYISCIGGVMVSVLALGVVDRGFKPQLGQTKNYKIGIMPNEQFFSHIMARTS